MGFISERREPFRLTLAQHHWSPVHRADVRSQPDFASSDLCALGGSVVCRSCFERVALRSLSSCGCGPFRAILFAFFASLRFFRQRVSSRRTKLGGTRFARPGEVAPTPGSKLPGWVCLSAGADSNEGELQVTEGRCVLLRNQFRGYVRWNPAGDGFWVSALPCVAVGSPFTGRIFPVAQGFDPRAGVRRPLCFSWSQLCVPCVPSVPSEVRICLEDGKLGGARFCASRAYRLKYG